MSKFKHAALALAAAGLLSAQAQAGEAQVQSLQAMPVAAFSQSDIQGLFEQAGQPMELAALSSTEMKETEGAALPLVAGLLLSTGGWTAGGAAIGAGLHAGHLIHRGMPITQLRPGHVWRGAGSVATGGFFASPAMRAAFGARNFARFTVSAVGASSWWIGAPR